MLHPAARGSDGGDQRLILRQRERGHSSHFAIAVGAQTQVRTMDVSVVVVVVVLRTPDRLQLCGFRAPVLFPVGHLTVPATASQPSSAYASIRLSQSGGGSCRHRS